MHSIQRMKACHCFVIAGRRAATPDNDTSMPGDDASDQDLPVPDEIPDVLTEPEPNGHGSGRSKARAQVP